MATNPDEPVASDGQPPDGPDTVRSAFRLGWAIAELRGRCRPDRIDKPIPDPGPAIVRTEHALPLANERSPTEQRIEVIHAVKGLSQELAVDFPLGGQTRPQQLDPFLDALSLRGSDPGAWDQLTNALYNWDAQIQDTLVLRPSQAAAYQLGRGLSETYWSLDPGVTDANDARSWLFLLGKHRRDTLERYAARLVAFLDPLVLPAVKTSLEAWGGVAADERCRGQHDALKQLYAQGLMWRDLIRGERRPEDLDPVPVSDIFEEVRLIHKLWSAFWPQLALGALGAAVLVVGIVGLVAGTENRSISTAFLVLGVLGVTLAGGYAKAKASAASVLETFRGAIDRERAGRAATLAPPCPVARGPAHSTKPTGSEQYDDPVQSTSSERRD
jgi:hypothetical protein